MVAKCVCLQLLFGVLILGVGEAPLFVFLALKLKEVLN